MYLFLAKQSVQSYYNFKDKTFKVKVYPEYEDSVQDYFKIKTHNAQFNFTNPSWIICENDIEAEKWFINSAKEDYSIEIDEVEFDYYD